jgi:hypothetical protein
MLYCVYPCNWGRRLAHIQVIWELETGKGQECLEAVRERAEHNLMEEMAEGWSFDGESMVRDTWRVGLNAQEFVDDVMTRGSAL